MLKAPFTVEKDNNNSRNCFDVNNCLIEGKN